MIHCESVPLCSGSWKPLLSRLLLLLLWQQIARMCHPARRPLSIHSPPWLFQHLSIQILYRAGHWHWFRSISKSNPNRSKPIRFAPFRGSGLAPLNRHLGALRVIGLSWLLSIEEPHSHCQNMWKHGPMGTTHTRSHSEFQIYWRTSISWHSVSQDIESNTAGSRSGTNHW